MGAAATGRWQTMQLSYRIGATSLLNVSVFGFSLAALIGLYMVWKIVRTPGEL